MPKSGWKPVATGGQARMSHDESTAEIQAILKQLQQDQKLRLTIEWTLEQDCP